MVVVAKLSLIAATHTGPTTPTVAALLWPFVLKLSFCFGPIHDACIGMMHGLRLFFFQLGLIAFDSNSATVRGGGVVRWQRALRLLYQRIANARPTQSTQDSFVIVSMLAL